MAFAKYRLEATPLFEAELERALDYIEAQLKNPVASDRLQADVEKAVRKARVNPTAGEPVRSRTDREHPYYRIYVGNYIVFYCVVGDAMELRRFVYSGRNWKRFL